MRLEYQITDEPLETEGHNVTVFTEGTLTVEHGGATFLEADGILLVELAVVLHKWLLQLHAGNAGDLYYASMDFEEEPILALRYHPTADRFTLESVWAKGQVSAVARTDAIAEARRYIASLRSELAKRLSVSLDEILQEAVADDPEIQRLIGGGGS